MNAVEIEEAVSKLASEPLDSKAFPYAFPEAFGNPTTIAKLKSGASNASDVPGGVLQRRNIHLAVCAPGEVTRTLAVLKACPATQNPRNKIKFVLATDGETIEAENLSSIEGATVACPYADLPNHFGFFLPLARHYGRRANPQDRSDGRRRGCTTRRGESRSHLLVCRCRSRCELRTIQHQSRQTRDASSQFLLGRAARSGNEGSLRSPLQASRMVSCAALRGQ